MDTTLDRKIIAAEENVVINFKEIGEVAVTDGVPVI